MKYVFLVFMFLPFSVFAQYNENQYIYQQTLNNAQSQRDQQEAERQQEEQRIRLQQLEEQQRQLQQNQQGLSR